MTMSLLLLVFLTTLTSGVLATDSACNNTALVKCTLQCDFGYRIESGCLKCACALDPCADKQCPKPKVCKVEPIPSLPMQKIGKCVEKDLPDRCQPPRFSGPCMALFYVWYYDTQEHMCKEFVYGGCRGNLNRFRTAEECRRVCIDVPEHKAKYPSCPVHTSKGCFNFCKYGHAMQNECPSCTCRPNPCKSFNCGEGKVCKLDGCIGPHNCQTAKPKCVPKCAAKRRPCDPCPYGVDVDDDGCPTCKCLPDPCKTHTCPELQKCRPVKDGDCIVPPCQYKAACTALQHVSQIDVEMLLLHDHKLVITDVNKFKIKVRKYISKLLQVDEDSISNIKFTKPDKESIKVQFRVRIDASQDLRKKYYDMKDKLYKKNIHTPIVYNGHRISLDTDTLHATVPEKDSNNHMHKMYTVSAMAAGLVCGVIGLVILLAIVIVAVKRRRHIAYRGSSNIPYKGMNSRVKEDRVAII